MVVFSQENVADDQAGALFFKVDNGEMAKTIIENLHEYIPHDKDEPNDCILIKQII